MGLFDRIRDIVRAKQGSAQDQPVVQRNLTNVRVGDILTHDLVDYKVEGVNVYRGGGQRLGYVLSNGSEMRYLLVEQKERLRVYLLETISARLENPNEINYEMDFEGVTYFEAARGESPVVPHGNSAFSSYDPVYWWLHLSDDNRAMLFEWQKGEIVIRVGFEIKPYECMILAGSE